VLFVGVIMRIDDEGRVLAEYADIAQAFGVSLRSAQRLGQEGVLVAGCVRGRKAEFDFVRSVTAYVQKLQADCAEKNKNKSRKELELQKLQADIALKTVQQELHQFKADKQNGKLIGVEDVQADYRAFLIALNKFLSGIPKLAASLISGLVPPDEERKLEIELKKSIANTTRQFVIKAAKEDAKA
jgi:phage terminase Nu1 subunit (DNA packaging protein)